MQTYSATSHTHQVSRGHTLRGYHCNIISGHLPWLQSIPEQFKRPVPTELPVPAMAMSCCCCWQAAMPHAGSSRQLWTFISSHPHHELIEDLQWEAVYKSFTKVQGQCQNSHPWPPDAWIHLFSGPTAWVDSVYFNSVNITSFIQLIHDFCTKNI